MSAQGKNPFELRNQQKKLVGLKEKRKELSNFNNAEKEKVQKSKEMKEKNSEPQLQANREAKIAKNAETKAKKNANEIKSFKKVKNQRLEKDKKGLSSQLENIQKSTASMGKFDKKLKNEKQLNPLKKNKISQDILLNRKSERERDRKILDNIVSNKKAKKA
jgi:hypothetical protein